MTSLSISVNGVLLGALGDSKPKKTCGRLSCFPDPKS